MEKESLCSKIDTVVRSRSRVLWVERQTVYAQIGNRLCSSVDSGRTWSSLFTPLPSGARALSRMHARIHRRGLHCVKVLKDGTLLLVAKGALYRYDTLSGTMDLSFSILRGSRPLFICENRNGDLFWGEYFNNPERDEVNVYVSGDLARTWQIVYKFEKNRIRHIHGVLCDPYDDRIWLTTGDEDRESAIWVTDDQFKHLEKVIGGNQRSRVMQFLFTRDYIYFGTDTPFEKNHIFRLDKRAGRVEEIVPVDSSVYWGCKVGDSLFFSTAVEPSRVNTSNFVCIWGSRDGRNWREVAKYKKDFWPSKYFQIGQIYFPEGNNSTGYLFYTPLATDFDMTVQRMQLADML